MAELKPCPFCGSDDVSSYEEIYVFFSFPKRAFVKCNYCGRKVEKRTLKNAIIAWNTRTSKGGQDDEL